MTIPAKYENGVFKPLEAVQMKEGTVVEVRVPTVQMPVGPRRSIKDLAFFGIWKEREDIGDGPCDLRHLDGVREPIPEVIGDARGEDLSLVLQPAEGARVNNAIAVALKGVAVRMAGLGIPQPARRLDRKPEMSRHRVVRHELRRHFKRGECYFRGRLFIAVTAIWLTSDFSAASCVRSFLASSGFAGAMTFA